MDRHRRISALNSSYTRSNPKRKKTARRLLRGRNARWNTMQNIQNTRSVGSIHNWHRKHRQRNQNNPTLHQNQNQKKTNLAIQTPHHKKSNIRIKKSKRHPKRLKNFDTKQMEMLKKDVMCSLRVLKGRGRWKTWKKIGKKKTLGKKEKKNGRKKNGDAQTADFSPLFYFA